MNTVYSHDASGRRSDIHAPSAINPGDYEYIRVDEARGELKAGKKLAGPGGTCHHCGKAIVWCVFFKHLPTGNVVTFGYQCADILKMTDNRIDHEMNLLKRAAARERKEEQWKQTVEDRNADFRAQYPELVVFLNEFDEDNGFVNRIKWGIQTYGSPLDYQIDSLKRFIAGREKLLLARMEEAKKLQSAPVLVEGRQTLVGVVLSTKYQHSDFGTVLKMRVQLDNGNKVYGTVPNDLLNEVGDENLVNTRVHFDAKVEPKEDHFGYFSRPTKAKVV